MTVWTDEMIADLRQMKVDEGVSVTQIAINLNQKYSLSLTRNSVSGKCDRQGYKSPTSIYPAKRKIRTRRAPVKKPVAKSKLPVAGKIQTRLGGPKNLPVTDYQPTPLEKRTKTKEPKPLGEIGALPSEHGCRYPHNDYPNIRFCGHPRGQGRASYCEFHHKICCVKPEQRQGRRRAA